MFRSKSSHNWLQEHFNDPYVKEFQEVGCRSCTSYQLLELLEKDDLE